LGKHILTICTANCGELWRFGPLPAELRLTATLADGRRRSVVKCFQQ